MEITVYKRHSNDCEHKADRAFRRCTCRMMMEWSENGKRFRVSAKTRSWTEAEQRARARMQDAHARTIGEQPKAGEPITLERAVEMFAAKKSSKHKQTRRKYECSLRNLKAWAVRNGRHDLVDITESDLEKYQASWSVKSNYAKRNEQERLRSFFRYCCASAEIKLAYNPTAQLEHFNVTSDEPEDPYTEKEYKAIVAAVNHVPSFTGEVTERVKALIAVMRYAGLAIQDAAILERDAIMPATVNGRACYRVQIRRSKTHTGINNVVPKDVGDALLRVANGNPRYIFWSGNGDLQDKMGRRTMHYQWAANLRDKVKAAGLPFMFKQVTAPRSGYGYNALDGKDWHEFPPSPNDLEWAPRQAIPDKYKMTKDQLSEFTHRQ